MGKFDDLQLPKIVDGCSFAKLMATLDDQDRTILQDALDDSRWATRVLHQELQRRGLQLSRDTLATHRNGRCKCSKA